MLAFIKFIPGVKFNWETHQVDGNLPWEYQNKSCLAGAKLHKSYISRSDSEQLSLINVTQHRHNQVKGGAGRVA